MCSELKLSSELVNERALLYNETQVIDYNHEQNSQTPSTNFDMLITTSGNITFISHNVNNICMQCKSFFDNVK